jgi:nucleoid DNA-binding protein
LKLNQLNEKIATACDMRPKAVLAVQRETFRMIDEALNKGERVVVPGFGAFMVREIEQKGGTPKKIVRFRRKEEGETEADETSADAPEEKTSKRGRKRAKSAETGEEQTAKAEAGEAE